MKVWHFAVPATEKRYLMNFLGGSNVFRNTYEFGNSQKMQGWTLVTLRGSNAIFSSLQKVVMDFLKQHRIRWVPEKGRDAEIVNELPQMNRESAPPGPLQNEELQYVSPWRRIGVTNVTTPWEYVWNKPGVGVLPYRINPQTQQLEFLCRIEAVPSYGSTPLYTCVTGRADEGELPVVTAMRELREETGYDCQDETKWQCLGAMRLGKSAVNAEILYCVDLTGVPEGQAAPEEREQSAQNVWVKAGQEMQEFMAKSDCCYLSACFGKMICAQLGTYGQA